jgi:N-acetylglucosamine kinase-like BadF-type ATPase
MTPKPDRTIAIGIDAGGSKTTAWLVPAERFRDADEPVVPVAAATTGCGNVRAAGFDAAVAEIVAAIETVLRDANAHHRNIPLSICLSAAGAGRSDEREQLTTELNRRFSSAAISVTGDAEPVLAAASSDCVGVALIAGTGSLAWGRNRHGDIERCGGWGYLFGDEGSGYAVGVAALRAAAVAADGRGPRTQLLPRLCEHFRIDRADQLIDAVYGQPPLSRQSIATLSGLVFELADRDRVAAGIVGEAAAALAKMVDTLAVKLKFDEVGPSPVLAFAGGLLVHRRGYADRVIARLQSSFAPPRTVPEPVAGAVRLAAFGWANQTRGEVS